MPPRGSPAARWRLPLEFEDLLLAAWIASGSLALRRWATPWLGVGPEGGDPTTGGWLVLGVAWAFLLFTRGPEDDDREVALKRRLLLAGPALPILPLYAIAATAFRRRRPRRSSMPPSGEPPWPGPPVARLWRRTAALPFLVIGDAVFEGSHEMTLLRQGVFDEPFLWIGMVAVYVFAVIGPRVAAGATLSPWVWVVRLAVFFAATWWSFRGAPGPA